MPKTKKEEKKGTVDPAKKAEAKKKTEEALKETKSTASEVEKKSPEPKRAGRPDWYEDMKERTSRAHTYMRCFDVTKKDVGSTYSIKKLDQIREASNQKLFEMSFLEEGTVKCHEKMMSDTEHEKRKVKGQEYYERTMSRISRAKQKHSDLLDAIETRKEEIKRDPKQAKKSSIIERFREMGKNHTMLQLIRRVRLFETNPGYKEKATTWYGKAAETVMGVKNAIMTEGITEVTETSSKIKSTTDDLQENAEELQNAIEGIDKEDGPLKGIFGMVKNTAGLIKDTFFFIKDFDKRSSENNLDQMIGIVTSGMSTLADVAGKLASLLSNFPFIGPIIGLIKNGIKFFTEGYKLFRSQRRIRKLREQKKILKERMLKRKKKYASDPELKGLYKYIGEGEGGQAELDADKLGKREYRGLRGSGSDARDKMKRAESSKTKAGKKKAYYAAKEAETVEQYDEIKEAIHKNKNRTKDATVAIVQEGIDVAANIAKFFPGTGDVVSAAIKVGSTIAGAGKFVGSKMVDLGKSAFGHRRSKENKKKFRSKYAEHIYDHMAEVSEYLDGEGKIDLNKADPSRVRKVAESYDYAENMLTGMGVDMADMVGAKSKGELLEAMSEAFGAGD